MAGSNYLTYALLGGAGYLAYKAFAQGSASAFPLGMPAASYPAGNQPPVSSASDRTNNPTTPTVTTPGTQAPSITPDSLTAAAVASGNPAMLNPDQWDWLIANVLHGQPFALDPSFGPVSQSSRTRTYTARDFIDIATGVKPAPAGNSPEPTVTVQTCPPNCGSDPATAVLSLSQVLQAAAGNVTELNPDQWNWYASGAYDIDRLFGPVGSPHRDGAYTAAQFAGVVVADVSDPSGGLSGLGWFTTDPGYPHNPLLRPNIPQIGRWLVPELRGKSMTLAGLGDSDAVRDHLRERIQACVHAGGNPHTCIAQVIGQARGLLDRVRSMSPAERAQIPEDRREKLMALHNVVQSATRGGWAV